MDCNGNAETVDLIGIRQPQRHCEEMGRLVYTNEKINKTPIF